ncbi:hypothetical protein JCGZ_18141 [Jatropha curcas]|uniref:Uncharacterized protein n=1 Tax=Jatropha curcas TaxID=180498 RepID=A0A067K5U2_JATCU|nr:hypothetical protein JCGZ_18141 [Jatropha curcas]
MSVPNIVQQALSLLDEYQGPYMAKEVVASKTSSARWSPPAEGVSKINRDATIMENVGFGFGMIVHNSRRGRSIGLEEAEFEATIFFMKHSLKMVFSLSLLGPAVASSINNLVLNDLIISE